LQFLTPGSIRIFFQNCSMSLANDFLRRHQNLFIANNNPGCKSKFVIIFVCCKFPIVFDTMPLT